MNQEHQRPAVYRSLTRSLLVGCESSEGSSRCGANGRSKILSSTAMETTFYTQRAPHQDMTKTRSSDKREEGEAMAYRGNSDLKLLQISREAQKLNQMIDSWSRAPGFDGRSKDIAEDLLRGALDLQESLAMLGKLQEASKFMAQAKKREKQSPVEEKGGGDLGVEMFGSQRFEMRNSSNGSRRTCVEGLKKVIKDSLHRQNLLLISSDDKKSSSSRSLRFACNGGFEGTCCEQKDNRESIVSFAAAQQKKAKAPNLIARLMGLEEVPPEMAPPVDKQPERKKNSVRQQRSFFDVEMPKSRKLPALEKKSDVGRKTLQEIIETMQFKGLLKGSRDEEPQIQPGSPDSSQVGECDRNCRKDDEVPPIVIIKPMRSPGFEREEVQKNFLPSNTSVQEKRQISKVADKEAVAELMLPKNVETNEEKTVKVAEGEMSTKVKTPASSSHKQPKKEAIKVQKKVNEVQKPSLDRRKLEENKKVRSVAASRSQIKISPMPNKPKKEPVRVKNHVSAGSSTLHQKHHRLSKPASSNSIKTAEEKRVTREKPVRESLNIKAVADNSICDEDHKEVSDRQETSISTVISALPSDDLPKETGDSGVREEDCRKRDSSSFCEVMPKLNLYESSKVDEAATQLAHDETATGVSAGNEDHLRRLLLSSTLFLSCAKELFNLNHPPNDCERIGVKEFGTDNSKLLLDCATELMTCKSHLSELINHPMTLSCVKGSIAKISLYQLVEEVRNEMEELRSYRKVVEGVTSEDGILTKLGRDLRCNGVLVNGGWDWGWMDVIPVGEADRIVNDVEEHILYKLIEEVVSNFCMHD